MHRTGVDCLSKAQMEHETAMIFVVFKTPGDLLSPHSFSDNACELLVNNAAHQQQKQAVKNKFSIATVTTSGLASRQVAGSLVH